MFLTSLPDVCYVGRRILSTPIEGHHVASKRIIESAIHAGINVYVDTIESYAKINKIPQNWSIEYLKNSRTCAGLPFFSFIDEFRALLKVSSKLKASNCNLIHVLNVTKETYLFSHELMRVKKPVLFHLYHSPYVLNDDFFYIRKLALKAGIYGRLLDNYVLTINDAMRKFLIENLGIDSSRVQFVPYPIDTDRFKPINSKRDLREKYGLPLDSPIVTYVGSLHSARGLSLLMRSFCKTLSHFPQLKLFISHPNHKNSQAYQKALRLIHDLNIEKNVYFTGPKSRIEEIYNLADIAVLPFQRPYWIDPPLVLLEAMSCGCPVITTPVGSIRDIITHNENAILVEPGDCDNLARGMIELLENPNKAVGIAEKGRKTIVENYSYEKVGKELVKFYNFILSRS